MENLSPDYFMNSSAFTKVNHRDIYPAIEPSSSVNSQAGKVIIITGASKGLGRLAFASSFAHANAKAIVLVARSAEALQEVSKEVHAINPRVEVLTIRTDITDAASGESMYEKVKENFGHADVLVNNAGTFANAGPISQIAPDTWWSDFEVNVRGTFLVTRGFLSLLGHSTHGTIINLVSGAAYSVVPSLSPYALSKLVALQIQAFVAAENPNVSAVALHPGIVMTDMVTEMFKPFALDTPALVGGVAVWLATDKARWLSGRYVSANWSVEELVERKEEILNDKKLVIALTGKFGMEQFA